MGKVYQSHAKFRQNFVLTGFTSQANLAAYRSVLTKVWLVKSDLKKIIFSSRTRGEIQVLGRTSSLAELEEKRTQ